MYFRWLGGKSKLVDKIISTMPKHDIYVEPFIGAGWVFWSKIPAPVEVINDLDSRLIRFYIGLSEIDDLKLVVDKYGWPYGMKTDDSRKLFDRAKVIIENYSKYDYDEFVWAFLYVNKFAYAGRMFNPTFNPRRIKDCIRPYCGIKTLLNDFYKVKKRLKNTEVLNMDWSKPTIEYDTESTLFYLDPPYVGTSKNSFTETDYKTRDHAPTPRKIFKLLDTLEGKFILSYDYHPVVLKYVKKYGFNYEVVTLDYEVRKNKYDKTVKEVIVTNFDYNKQLGLMRFLGAHT